MASGPETEKLIAAFQRKASKASSDKKDVEKSEEGLEIKNEKDELIAKIENLDEIINAFDPSTKGLDSRVLTLNSPVSDAQIELYNLWVGAEQVGCSTYVDDTTPVIDIFRDQVTLFDYDYTNPTYTGDDPFNESSTAMTTSNVGFATFTGITTVSIGTFFALTGSCPSYASSITAKENEITSLRATRDTVRVPINEIKEGRSEYQLQRFGFQKTKSQLDEDLASANLIISTLQNPDIQQFILE